MDASLLIGLILGYFVILIGISFLAGKNDDHQTFFLGNRNSPWYAVAFGMVGASLSGVTFLSVPGLVANNSFAYMQVVLGYVAGYLVIMQVLLPLYYRLNLTSIYTYLQGRFGPSSYTTGSIFFLISRVIGAAFRLYLIAIVLQTAIFDGLNIPFWITVLITIVLIWVYTFRSGIKTIIWTDTLQTALMLGAVFITVYMISQQLLDGDSLISYVQQSEYSQIFFFDDWKSGNYFFKNFLSGMFITIVMTGLDQDMMQKNLSCRSLGDAKKNMFWLALTLVAVNLVFLALGALLYDFAALKQIAFDRPDQLYTEVALSGELGSTVLILFILGLVAAAYSSADSALTALTTSFCVDILQIEKMEVKASKITRKLVHLGFSAVLFLVILIFHQLNDDSVINELFTAAGYTYGPLLGLYAFGLYTRRKVADQLVPIAAVLAPVLSYLIRTYAKEWYSYSMSFEHLIINGLLMFLFLLSLSKPNPSAPDAKTKSYA
jgi:Na+/proline symporter